MRGADSTRTTCQERNKTDPTVNKTESSVGEARRARDSVEREAGGKVEREAGGKAVRETKSSRLRAATHTARTEPEVNTERGRDCGKRNRGESILLVWGMSAQYSS